MRAKKNRRISIWARQHHLCHFRRLTEFPHMGPSSQQHYLEEKACAWGPIAMGSIPLLPLTAIWLIKTRYWNWARPCGAPGYRSLSVPLFLCVGNRFQPPWPSLSSKGQIWTVANEGRQGMGEDAETREETTWGQIKGVQTLHTPWSLSAALPLNHCYKTPHQILPGWDTQFLRHESSLSPFTGQSNKAILFLLHPKLCLRDSIQHQCTETEFLASVSRALRHRFFFYKMGVIIPTLEGSVLMNWIRKCVPVTLNGQEILESFHCIFWGCRSLIIDNSINSLISCLSGKLYSHNDLEKDVR